MAGAVAHPTPCPICLAAAKCSSYREVGRILGIDKNTVKRHLTAYNVSLGGAPAGAGGAPQAAATPKAQPVQQVGQTPALQPTPYDLEVYAYKNFYKCSLRDAQQHYELKRRIEQVEVAFPRYTRPPELSKKQHHIIDELLLDDYTVALLVGDRRVGKSTILTLFNHEYIISRHPVRTRIEFAAAKGGNKSGGAVRLVDDMFNDPLIHDINQRMIKATTARRYVWFNDSTLNVHDLTTGDIKGAGSEVIEVDEFDESIRINPRAIMNAMMIIRDKPNAKIVLAANMGEAAFQSFKKLLEDARFMGRTKVLTLEKHEVPHIAKAGNDDLLAAMSDALVDPEFTAAQLDNKPSTTGQYFNVDALHKAFETYDEWIDNNRPKPELTVLGIDPGGTGHPTGYYVWSVWRDHVYEEESGEIYGIDPRTGEKWNLVKKLSFLAELARSYGADIVLESNTGGTDWAMEWETNFGLNGHVHLSNFGPDGAPNARDSYIHDLNLMLEGGRAHVKSQLFKNKATIYNPASRMRDGSSAAAAKAKGDIVDAAMHGLHLIKQLLPRLWKRGKSATVVRSNYQRR